MWNKIVTCVSIGALVAGVVACGESQTGSEPTPTTRELLGAAVEFSLDQPGSSLAITARALHGNDVAVHRIAMPVPDGSLALRAGADGDLRLEKLELELDDVVIDPDDLPPAGLHLTNLKVKVDSDVAETSWSADGTSALASLAATVTLEWALVSEGRVLPLAPQKITDVELAIEIGQASDGGVAVTMRGGHSGTVLKPAGTFELSDLTLEINTQN
jgi:hypothetical protein